MSRVTDAALIALVFFGLLFAASAPTPVRSEEAVCKHPEQVIADFNGIADYFGFQGVWRLLPPEQNRQVLVTQLAGGPFEVHVFTDRCFERTLRAPPLLNVLRVDT